MIKKLRNLFLTGILVLLPLIVSVFILWYLFELIESWAGPVVEVFFGRELPGVGLALTVLLIFLAGLFATNFLGKKLIRRGELILLKIPLFRSIYISVKQLLEGMFTRDTKSFEKAIILEYPRRGIYQIGFITREESPFFESYFEKKVYKVFLPTTPNPTSGMFLLVPEEDVIMLDASVEEALKLVVSAGIITPDSGKRLDHTIERFNP
ncbi:MAG: DUF502 domain-containing protein [Halanaerobiaceae bacterium]